MKANVLIAASAGTGKTQAHFERMGALVDPARVEYANMLAAWREKYANEITERTKKMWWLRRLWRKVG
jgi:ATP-dependent exoDNAse (exonuclease V) beta subunit